MPSFSPIQLQALNAVEEWFKKLPKQVFKLMGYAGTGKTTLAKFLAEKTPGQVNFGAYTGKAASVMRQRGCIGAATIHSLMYLVKERSKQSLLELEEVLVAAKDRLEDLKEDPKADKGVKARLEEQILEYEAKVAKERKLLSQPNFSINPDSTLKYSDLIILDECSMIAEEMGQDLLSFGKPILVLGDPAQLPPVFGQGYFTKGEADITLTEIHRQAEGNPLIQLATKVRNRQPLKAGVYGESRVLDDGDKLGEDVKAFDQILVGKNATRHWVNKRMREILGFKEWHPIPGDKLVCLRNNHELGLLNGTLWQVLDIGDIGKHRSILTLKNDEGDCITTEIHSAPFRGEEVPFYEKKEAEEFDYGYAITVHKAQGSQWNDVLLYDESFCFKDKRFNWLYTGITRAANRVTILPG